MGKQIVVHSSSGKLIRNTDEQTTGVHNMDDFQKSIMLSERSQTLKSAYCVVQFI